MKLIFCIIIAALSISFASTVQECPSIPPAGNFNYQKWAEKSWRVVNVDTKNDFGYYSSGKCITDTYNPLDGKLINGVTKSLSLITGKQSDSAWHGVVGEIPGVMTFSYVEDDVPYGYETLRVIDTDNSTYSINFSCGYNKPGNPPKLYIAVEIYFRGPGQLPPEVLENSKLILHKYGIDVTFRSIEWNDCPETVQ